jgi:RNA polymerase sigma-70 factor (ECF subfamily)
LPGENIYDEKELLDRLRQGEQQAFTQLYHLYSERLYGNLLKLVKSPAVAEEILQDIFIRIWEKRQTIDIHTSFRSYLFRIGENKVIDFYRRARRDKDLYAYIKAAATEQYTHIEESLLSRENAELLQTAIGALPPQRRQVFELCKLQGKSYQEVSGLLNISVSTINDHIVKATRSIRQHIWSRHGTAGALLLLAALKALS